MGFKITCDDCENVINTDYYPNNESTVGRRDGMRLDAYRTGYDGECALMFTCSCGNKVRFEDEL